MTDFGNTTYPKAAKVHRCIWCGESILKGENHAHFSGKWDGEFQDWRMHRECYTDADDSEELQDGFMPFDHERPVAAPHPQKEIALLLNRLILAASSKGYQMDRPEIPADERITDADIEKLEGQILELLAPHPQTEKE